MTPGVIHDPEWQDHGSLFAYDWNEKIWIEFDYSLKEITDRWRLKKPIQSKYSLEPHD